MDDWVQRARSAAAGLDQRVGAPGSAIYCVGFIGALGFYIRQADDSGPASWVSSRRWCGLRSCSYELLKFLAG
jgi:hypothetical protein